MSKLYEPMKQNSNNYNYQIMVLKVCDQGIYEITNPNPL
jgi:hypothetical protein